MPLVFSPLTEAVLESAPKSLFPKHAFVMRQLGGPPDIDLEMTRIVEDVLTGRGFGIKDANASTGGKDFLERILGLIRPCGRIFASRRFWDSRGESGMIHRTPTESGAGGYVDKDG